MNAHYLYLLDEFAKENCPCKQSGDGCKFCFLLFDILYRQNYYGFIQCH